MLAHTQAYACYLSLAVNIVHDAHTHTQIRMQQEKIWELQAQEENVRTELEELKGTPRTCVHVSSVHAMRSLHTYCVRVLLCANLIDHAPLPEQWN